MASERALSEFNERVSKLPSIDNITLGKVYNSDGNLLIIIPNLPEKSKSLRIFYAHGYKEGYVNIPKALEVFGQELLQDAKGDKHLNIQLLKDSLTQNKRLKVKFFGSNNENVLEAIVGGNATPEQKLEGLQLLQSGGIRTAEKTYGIKGDKPMWEPQQYAIDALNSGFSLFKMGKFPQNPQYVDKIPLWTQKVDLISGVNSPFMSEKDLIETGVRLVPGSFARIGAYIGKGTTVMPGGIINIGAYVAGDGVMIDGGARVSSGAQIGKGVKLGGGSGLEGVLEPAGIIPTIIEDNVRVGADCEITGIVGEGSLIGSGVVMAAGKKIYDEREEGFINPLYVETADGVKAIPYIPKNRIAVGGCALSKNLKIGKNIIILLEKDASDSSFMDIPKNPQLYIR